MAQGKHLEGRDVGSGEAQVGNLAQEIGLALVVYRWTLRWGRAGAMPRPCDTGQYDKFN
jgi:hypothetical protein